MFYFRFLKFDLNGIHKCSCSLNLDTREDSHVNLNTYIAHIHTCGELWANGYYSVKI